MSFVCGCARSSLRLGCFPSCGEQGLHSSCGLRASHCGDFCCRARAVAARAHGLRTCGPRALVLGLSACGTRASLSRGMRALPGPGVEPTPPALERGFFTAETPGSARLYLHLQNSSLPWKKRWRKAMLKDGLSAVSPGRRHDRIKANTRLLSFHISLAILGFLVV